MLTNVLFGFAGLCYLGLVIFNFSKPSLTGEAAMGYGLGLAFWGLLFTVSSLLLVLNIGGKGGFDWLSPQSGTRNLLLGMGWLCLIVATFFSAAFKWEWHNEFPEVLHWLALSRSEIWLPLLVLVPSFLLWKSGGGNSFAPLLLKAGIGICALFTLVLLYGWFTASVKQQNEIMKESVSRDTALQNEHLRLIASQKPDDPIVNILALTGRFHEAAVRNAAVTKVMSHPEWEGELVNLLGNKAYFKEVYTFIDGTSVDHPELFIAPLKQSILMMAEEIKEEITDTNNLQDWHFEHYGIERLLRAIDWQFSLSGADFVPEMKVLSAALATTPPEQFKNVKLKITPIVNAWLKEHS